MNDVAEFLFGDRPTPLHRPQVVTPAACFVQWERALFHGRELLLLLLGPAVPEPVRAQARWFIEHYRRTPFANEVGKLRIIGLTFAHPIAPGMDHDHPDRLVQWENRYFLRCHTQGGGGRPYGFAAIERSADGQFRLPPGAQLDWEQPLIAPLEAHAIDKALALLAQRGPFPFEPKAAERLTEATGMMREAAARVLTGCQFTDPDKAGRAVLHVTLKQVGYAQRELFAKDSHFIVAGAAPQDPEELYRPLQPGVDGQSFVDRLAQRWVASVGKRPVLASELVERMEDDIRNPYPPFVEAARALLDPDSIPMLARDATWVHRPFERTSPDDLRFGSVPGGWLQHHDEGPTNWVRRWPDREAFSYEGVALYLKYLAWAHLELPVGEPLRRGSAEVATRIRARLSAPQFLLPVALGKVADAAAFAEVLRRIKGQPYRAGDGGPSASGIESEGLVVVFPTDPAQRTGFLVSLRTSALSGGAATERALAQLGLLNAEGSFTIAGAEAVRVFPYLDHYRLWAATGFQSLVATLSTEASGINLFDANPQRSAPEAVRALQARLDLPTDAASLYLQIACLPEPTLARVLRYNGWSKAQYEAAAAPLIRRGLIIVAAPKGTTRTHFLPEPMVWFERYPGPVEASKLASLGLREGKVPPLDVPLPLCPVAELYQRRAAS